ncbi:hypothetical protein SAMN05192530_10270 [Aureimonas jatrophae]|uniref:Uncharacterized protein n=1 Tax=Aureimonas jatrophae TaxID=1166073 RepID=A0A1H0EJS0_9HYPH|nr:hypothetical protein SAMN05192530_10270 [Aureimonas jatrophae]
MIQSGHDAPVVGAEGVGVWVWLFAVLLKAHCRAVCLGSWSFLDLHGFAVVWDYSLSRAFVVFGGFLLVVYPLSSLLFLAESFLFGGFTYCFLSRLLASGCVCFSSVPPAGVGFGVVAWVRYAWGGWFLFCLLGLWGVSGRCDGGRALLAFGLRGFAGVRVLVAWVLAGGVRLTGGVLAVVRVGVAWGVGFLEPRGLGAPLPRGLLRVGSLWGALAAGGFVSVLCVRVGGRTVGWAPLCGAVALGCGCVLPRFP